MHLVHPRLEEERQATLQLAQPLEPAGALARTLRHNRTLGERQQSAPLAVRDSPGRTAQQATMEPRAKAVEGEPAQTARLAELAAVVPVVDAAALAAPVAALAARVSRFWCSTLLSPRPVAHSRQALLVTAEVVLLDKRARRPLDSVERSQDSAATAQKAARGARVVQAVVAQAA